MHSFYEHRIARGWSSIRIPEKVFLKGQPMGGLAQFKQMQKEGWRHFAPLEMFTTPAAARLVRFARVAAGMKVLDAGCGTGVVAITAARLSARVKAIDLTPQLLERARENGAVAEVDIEWQEGDVEELPFEDGEFDVVVSQFAHMFAPRPDVALREMLRVLRPGGTIAFSTWPPESVVGLSAQLHARYVPPSSEIPSPILWGDPSIIGERFGTAVEDISFDRDALVAPALSPQHYRLHMERTAGPMIKLIETLASDPSRLRSFRREFDAMVSDYSRDNVIHQSYLLTRARKI
jgi:SAM-dependent methyltransferase